MARKNVNKELETGVIIAYQAKMPINEICEKFSIKPSEIYRILNQNNITPNRSGFKKSKNGFRRKIDSEKEKEIVSLYVDQYIRTAEIAVKYNVCENTILRILRRYGVNTSKNYPSKQRREKPTQE